MIAISQFYKNQSNLATIDLGSNALRVLIIQQSNHSIKILKNIRYPIRLGEDVFKYKKISAKSSQKLLEIFVELLFLFTEFNVTEVEAVATSAMRDAKNRRKIVEDIFNLTGIHLKVIRGKLEAQIIANAVASFYPLGNKLSVIMDIGGGSTELIILKGKKIISEKSFNIGTVRVLRNHNPHFFESKIKLMERFLYPFIQNQKISYFIGTGGNLRRLGKAKSLLLKRKESHQISKEEIQLIEEKFRNTDDLDRLEKFKFDINQIDVFLPALQITNAVQNILSKEILHIPTLGLKEGLVLTRINDNKLRKKFIKESLKPLD